MKTILIFRGLARGRRSSLIDELTKGKDLRNFSVINTPAPKEKLTKEQMKDLAARAFNDFKLEIAKGTELIIVNNNNSKKYHYFQYLDYGQRHEYLVGLVVVPWEDMSDRELTIDSGGLTPENVFRRYRKEFQWEL